MLAKQKHCNIQGYALELLGKSHFTSTRLETTPLSIHSHPPPPTSIRKSKIKSCPPKDLSHSHHTRTRACRLCRQKKKKGKERKRQQCSRRSQEKLHPRCISPLLPANRLTRGDVRDLIAYVETIFPGQTGWGTTVSPSRRLDKTERRRKNKQTNKLGYTKCIALGPAYLRLPSWPVPCCKTGRLGVSFSLHRARALSLPRSRHDHGSIYSEIHFLLLLYSV